MRKQKISRVKKPYCHNCMTKLELKKIPATGQQYAQCPRCMASFSWGEVEIKVEGEYSDEVKDVTTNLIDKLHEKRKEDYNMLQNKKLKKELTNDKIKKLLVVGGFWIGAFIVLGFFILQIASKDIDWYKFIAVLFTLPILFTLVGAFILKTTSSLKEENFMKLIALTLKLNFKGLNSLTETRKADRKDTSEE